MHQINTPYTFSFPSDASLPLTTGLLEGDFVAHVFLNGAVAPWPAVFSEIGAGFYSLSITPDQTGYVDIYLWRASSGEQLATVRFQATLQSIDDVAQVVPLGDHVIQFTIEDVLHAPIPNAWIHVWNASKTTRIALVRANDDGEASILLNNGTYAVFIQHPFGIQALSDETLVVSGPSSETYTLSSFSLVAPPSAHLCRVYGTVVDPRGAPLQNVEAVCYRESPHIAQDFLVGGKVLKANTNSSGFFFFDLMRGSRVKIVIDLASWSKVFTVPDQSSVAYKDIVAV